MADRNKILVVEDEPEFRDAIRMRLESAGYDVIEAADGLAALELARKSPPDLILLDIMLPKLDGYKVCRLLKFDEQYRHIPIVMLTARSEVADRSTGMSVGADVYLAKPCKSQKVLDAISGLIGATE